VRATRVAAWQQFDANWGCCSYGSSAYDGLCSGIVSPAGAMSSVADIFQPFNSLVVMGVLTLCWLVVHIGLHVQRRKSKDAMTAEREGSFKS
jgi:hypothetical protein